MSPQGPPAIVKVFVEENADAAYGSRFAGAEVHRVLFYRHRAGHQEGKKITWRDGFRALIAIGRFPVSDRIGQPVAPAKSPIAVSETESH